MLVLAALGGGEHEAAVLDRARAHQHVPMGLAGLFGEGGGDRQERGAGLGQRAIERREAQIVANRQAEPAPRQVGDDGELAGTVGVGFAIALATGEIDIEHVDLVVARGDVALAIDQEGAVCRLLRRRLDGKRAEMDVDRKPSRDLAQSRQSRILLFAEDFREQALALVLEHVGHFRRLHVIGATALGFVDAGQHSGEIGLRLQA